MLEVRYLSERTLGRELGTRLLRYLLEHGADEFTITVMALQDTLAPFADAFEDELAPFARRIAPRRMVTAASPSETIHPVRLWALNERSLARLLTFLTAGTPEVRAWTVRSGAKAPEAAGVIHSDSERGFIRAEVIDYDDYVRYRTAEALRAAGKIRSEGKDYVMQEGDVVEFLFKV